MASIIAPAYDRSGVEYRDTNHSAMIRATHTHGHRHAPTVVEEPVIEHEHHHLHHHIDHHIDHGDVSARSVALSRSTQRPLMNREYSYDDLDVRRYGNGSTISIHHEHEHEPSRRRHRHRHRSRHGSRTRISRSEIDLTRISTGSQYEHDDVTVVDVPAGTRRIYVNVDNKSMAQQPIRDREVDWRREHGIRRSRGLGNELWTEITKDLVTREAIEDLGYPYEETDFFYYIFEYLDRDQIAEMRELTEEIRHERVRNIEYQSIAGSQASPRMRIERDFDDSRTEVIIESGSHSGSHSGGRARRRYYY
jgi:hypothetical protein